MSGDKGFLKAIVQNPCDNGIVGIYADWLEERDDPIGKYVRFLYEQKMRLGEIITNPGSDKLRLNYATWLEETAAQIKIDEHINDSRLQRISPSICSILETAKDYAEFIRMQHKSPEGGEWEELFRKHRKMWMETLGEHFNHSTHFQRGFPYFIELQQYTWDHHAEVIFNNAPITNVIITHVDDIASLCQSPHLTHVKSLTLDSNAVLHRYYRIGDEGVRALAESPHLTHLRLLRLTDHRIREQGARALAESPYLTSLEELFLYDNQISDQGAIALANSPRLTHLTRLDLSSNQISNEGAIALANSSRWTRLTQLDLSSNQIDNVGAIAFATSPNSSHLTWLNLGNNHIHSEGWNALHTASQTQGSPLYGMTWNDNVDGLTGSRTPEKALEAQEYMRQAQAAGTSHVGRLGNRPGWRVE